MTLEQDEQWLDRVVLGAFRLEAVVGEGGFAAAFLARQLGTDRHAVVKIARPEMLRGYQGEMLRERFATELRASTRVKHPNLVTVYTAGEIDGAIPAIAMEFVRGVTLETFLQLHTPLPPEVLRRLFGQLLSALSALHDAGIVHCDVTPSNIIVQLNPNNDTLRVTLLDFGIAILDDADSMEFEPMGTPRYTSTEQIYGHPTFASDMFSLGCLMWWAFTGREYLEVDTLREGLAAQRELPPWPRTRDGGFPREMGKLLTSLVHPDQDMRPDAVDVLRAWDDLMDIWSEHIDRIESQPRSGAMGGVLPPQSRPSHPSEPARSRPTHHTPSPSRPSRSRPSGTNLHSGQALSPQPSDLHAALGYRRRAVNWRQGVAVPSSNNSTASGLYRPRILLVDDDLERQQQLLSVLEIEPCRVQAITEPRLAPIHVTRRDYDGVLLSVGKIGLRGYDTAMKIRNRWEAVLGDPFIFLLANWDDNEDQWKAAGADVFIRAPDDLVHLPDYICQIRRRHTPIFDALSPEVIKEFAFNEPSLFWHTAETFIGLVPELLLTLEESIEAHDDTTAKAVCQELGSRSDELGADHMKRLATTVAQLNDPELLPQRLGLIGELENEYSKIAQDLLLYRQSQTDNDPDFDL